MAALAAVGCGEDDGYDPHEVESCASDWFSSVEGEQCEAVCSDRNSLGPSICNIPDVAQCGSTVEIDGVLGCCHPVGPVDDFVIRWQACQ